MGPPSRCSRVEGCREQRRELVSTTQAPTRTCAVWLFQWKTVPLAKFKIARAVLSDFDERGAAGHRVQWQILESLLDLNGPADREADPDEARAALKALREAAGPRSESQPDEGANLDSRCGNSTEFLGSGGEAVAEGACAPPGDFGAVLLVAGVE